MLEAVRQGNVVGPKGNGIPEPYMNLYRVVKNNGLLFKLEAMDILLARIASALRRSNYDKKNTCAT